MDQSSSSDEKSNDGSDPNLADDEDSAELVFDLHSLLLTTPEKDKESRSRTLSDKRILNRPSKRSSIPRVQELRNETMSSPPKSQPKRMSKRQLDFTDTALRRELSSGRCEETGQPLTSCRPASMPSTSRDDPQLLCTPSTSAGVTQERDTTSPSAGVSQQRCMLKTGEPLKSCWWQWRSSTSGDDAQRRPWIKIAPSTSHHLSEDVGKLDINLNETLTDFLKLFCTPSSSVDVPKEQSTASLSTDSERQLNIQSSTDVTKQQSTQSSSTNDPKLQSTPYRPMEQLLAETYTLSAEGKLVEKSTQRPLSSPGAPYLYFTPNIKMNVPKRKRAPNASSDAPNQPPCHAPAPSPTASLSTDSEKQLNIQSSTDVTKQQSTQSSSTNDPKLQSTPSTSHRPMEPLLAETYTLSAEGKLVEKSTQRPSSSPGASNLYFTPNIKMNVPKRKRTPDAPNQPPCHAPAPSPTRGVPPPTNVLGFARDMMERILAISTRNDALISPPKTKRSISESEEASSPDAKRHRRDVVRPVSEQLTGQVNLGQQLDETPRVRKRRYSSGLEMSTEGERKKSKDDKKND